MGSVSKSISGRLLRRFGEGTAQEDCCRGNPAAAAEKARLAEEEKTRLAASRAKKAEQEKAAAAAKAKAAEDARLVAERAKQIEEARAAAAEKRRKDAEAAATALAAKQSADKALADKIAEDKSAAELAARLPTEKGQESANQKVAAIAPTSAEPSLPPPGNSEADPVRATSGRMSIRCCGRRLECVVPAVAVDLQQVRWNKV